MLNKGVDSSSQHLPSVRSSFASCPKTDNNVFSFGGQNTGYDDLIVFLQNRNISLLKKKLLDFRGTHFPIAYRQNFNFQERWQKSTRMNEQVNFNVLMSSNIYCYSFSFIIMIFNFILIWFLSVFRLYSIKDCKPFFELGIIFIISDALLKLYLYAEHYKANNEAVKIQKIVLSFDFLTLVIGDFWCAIYFICIIADAPIGDVLNNQFIVFDLITLLFLIQRTSEIYNYLVILIIATKYKDEMTIFDLALKMLFILHFFSILLYSVALVHPDSNWMTRISIHESQWRSKYIYTLYFACTTMFTVGYGDILPTNQAQIITIMFIQALGMALFGYIVNEVGVALGNMRKKRTNLEKDIYNSERISKLYELNPDLRKKVRDYVISNQIAQQQLGINQENDFLLKLNEELRQEVKQSHQLKIIKTSLFFITHWSKKIQIEMAKKLQKCIFAPNQSIYAKEQVDTLFIMVKGKIEIFTEKKFGTKVSCRKLLKIIEKAPKQQVFNNVFGVTSFFSGKPNRLKTIAKESTICYTLGYEDIRDSINQDSGDFEYFHYLRQKFQISKIPQKWETPSIMNIRQNYNPVVYFIIKKHTKMSKKQPRNNGFNRKYYINKRVCELNFGRNQSQAYSAQSYDDVQSDTQKSSTVETPEQIGTKNEIEIEVIRTDEMLSHTPLQNQAMACIGQLLNSNQLISNRSYRRKYWNTQKQDRYDEKVKQFLEQHIILTSEFEIGKNYNRFFPKFNKKIVLEKLVKSPELIQKQSFYFGKNSASQPLKELSRETSQNCAKMKHFDQFLINFIFECLQLFIIILIKFIANRFVYWKQRKEILKKQNKQKYE